MLQCGMTELEITPPLGSSIPGYLEERKSQGIDTPLYAKALIVESAEITLALIVVDGLYVPERETARIRERLLQYTGIPAERIMVSATHTHTGPPIRVGQDGSRHDDYLAYMADWAADSAIIAYNNRRPARIGWGVGYVDDISFNRRFWMKDGTLRTNPGFLNPEIVRPAGPIDPEVSVIRIDHVDGRPIGILTCFACHTDTVGGTRYNGDYPSVLSRAVKEALGEQVVSLFMLGACGDINHVDTSKPKPDDLHMITGRIGMRLAEKVFQVREASALKSDAVVAASRSFMTMQLREVTKEEVVHARRVIADNVNSSERFFADHIMKVKDLPGGEVELEVQAFRIGELAIAGLPGEIFVKLGLSVKQASPYPHTIVNTLCNGSIYGYVCTEEAYTQGGYEPQLKVYNRVSPGTGERLASGVSDLLRQLHEMF